MQLLALYQDGSTALHRCLNMDEEANLDVPPSRCVLVLSLWKKRTRSPSSIPLPLFQHFPTIFFPTHLLSFLRTFSLSDFPSFYFPVLHFLGVTTTFSQVLEVLVKKGRAKTDVLDVVRYVTRARKQN